MRGFKCIWGVEYGGGKGSEMMNNTKGGGGETIITSHHSPYDLHSRGIIICISIQFSHIIEIHTPMGKREGSRREGGGGKRGGKRRGGSLMIQNTLES